MIVKTQQDIDGLKKIGRIVALTIQEMKKHAVAGISTRELDEIGERFLNEHGAKSAPKVTYDFPGATCISVNQEVAHGIPGDRILKAGDLVNIDVSAEFDGYYGDSGYSFVLSPGNSEIVKLCDYTQQTMMKVIRSIKAGTKLNEVGRLIEQEAHKGGYNVIQNLCSHGIGKSLHEEPQQIVHYYDPHEKRRFKQGQVVTIEPFLSTGADYVIEMPDGWTLKLPDQSFVAQFEHTIIITEDEPIITTSAD
ncbi:type I methionyl aminopeptidase [Marinicrinis lubricantis]|uniref:Methionine aminopeptidase n=1 Tax=Marinicrinis lubricantis TaxID=2086470 RepID=A0ABW1ILB2_9BACL